MRMLMVLNILLVLVLAVPKFVSADALIWAEYGRNAQNTGQSRYIGPTDTSRTWKAAMDYNNSRSFASPVVDGSGAVYLLDSGWSYVNDWVEGASLKSVARDGSVRWIKPLSGCRDYRGGTSLALGSNGLLYLSCGAGHNYVDGVWIDKDAMLYAFEAGTGALRWELPLGRHYTQAIGDMTIDSGNNLYFVSFLYEEGNHYLTAVSEAGAILWTSPLGAGRRSDFAGPAMSSDEKTVYIYRLNENNEGVLDAVSAKTGEKVWTLPLEWGGTGWQTLTSFAVANDGTIWLASYVKYGDDSCYGRAENLIGISPNGHIRRKFPLHGDLDCGSHISIGTSGTIYVTYDDVRQYWDGTSWYYWEEGAGWYSGNWSGVYVDGPPKKGGIAAYDAVKGFKWKFELPDSHEANAKPAIDANENIYFAASFGERLYSINKDGGLNWVFDIAPGVEPTHGSCGWFCAEDEFIYGVAPVIGLGGSIHVMGSKYLYTIEGGTIPIHAVTAIVEGLVSQGALNTGDGNSLLSKLAQAENAATEQARVNVLQATINQINALERSGRLTPAKAEEMRSILGQL